MTWAKLSDEMPDNPKIVRLSHRARWVYVASICYASRLLTDGFLPKETLPKFDGSQREVRALLDAGLWEEATDGWQIHDFLEYNPAAETVRAERNAAKERMQKARSVRPNKDRTFGDGSPSPSRPVPSRESVLNSGQLTDVAAAPLFEEIPEKREESPMGSELDQRSRETLASVRVKLGERVWLDDPSIEAEFRVFLGIHGGATVESAILDCYRANERPYPGNVRKRLPTVATAPPRRSTEPFRFMDAKDLKALRQRQWEDERPERERQYAAEERERVAALA